ncbi:MAG: hypothetical protein AAF340_00955 [Pseudomonadota bacterium]
MSSTGSTGTAKRIAIRPRVADQTLSSWGHRGRGETLVVCFSGVGKEHEACPSYEFARTASFDGAGHALFIADPQRSWLNTPALAARIAVEVVRFKQEVGARKVVAMGHSMGGFSALILPSLLPIENVLAFAPQISVDPDHVPDETRWAEYRDHISDFIYPSAQEHLTTQTGYTIIHGAHHREAPQRDRFVPFDTLSHYVLPNTHHNVPQRLKRMGRLQQVVRLALTGRRRKLRQMMVQDLGATMPDNGPKAMRDLMMAEPV